jgi:hypothetical protein
MYNANLGLGRKPLRATRFIFAFIETQQYFYKHLLTTVFPNNFSTISDANVDAEKKPCSQQKLYHLFVLYWCVGEVELHPAPHSQISKLVQDSGASLKSKVKNWHCRHDFRIQRVSSIDFKLDRLQ